LFGIEGARYALQYLPRGFGEIMVGCGHWPEVSDRPQDGEQANKL
jgi:hypothetical protein